MIRLARWRRSSTARRWRCAGRRRTLGRSSSTRARTRRPSIRWRRDGPSGGIFMWSEQRPAASRRRRSLRGSQPAGPNSSAAAMLSYDIPHKAPWDWRVQPLHLDQGDCRRRVPGAAAAAAAGAARADEPAVDLGRAGHRRALPRASPGPADLGPRSTRPASTSSSPARSGRAGWCGGRSSSPATALVLALHFSRGAGRAKPTSMLRSPSPALRSPLLTAVYTAYLFAQAKARDLWQNPLLPPHFVVQAVLGRRRCALLLASPWRRRRVTIASLVASSVRGVASPAASPARSRSRTAPRTPAWPRAR